MACHLLRLALDVGASPLFDVFVDTIPAESVSYHVLRCSDARVREIMYLTKELITMLLWTVWPDSVNRDMA